MSHNDHANHAHQDHGQAAQSGKVVVNGELHIKGPLKGNVIAMHGSVVEVNGVLDGSITNNGGKVTVRGTVTGEIVTHSGTTEILPGAIVQNG